MSDRSGEWFRDQKPQPPGNESPDIGGEPTVSLPARGAGQGASAAASNWPEQPPAYAGAATRSPQVQGPLPGYPGGGRRQRRPRRILKIVALLVVLVLVLSIGLYFYLDSKLTRVNVLVDYPGRPVASAGQNWLITGSDSRQGLTPQQENQLATGHDVSGQRSDTIMINRLLYGPVSRDLGYVGLPARRHTRLLPAGKAHRQRVHRSLQWTFSSRMSERALVPKPCRRPGKVGGLAQVLQ